MSIKYLLPLLILVGACFFSAQTVHSSEENTIRNTFLFGAGIHLGQPENKTYSTVVKVQPKLVELGVNATRDDLPWGVLDSDTPESLLISIGKMGRGFEVIRARPVVILKGDPKRLPRRQPLTDKGRAIYVEFAKHAATLLKGYNPIFELWNEWNLVAREDKTFGSAEQYVALAKAAYPAIKAIDPNGIVLGGAAGDDKNWEWTMTAVNLGLLDYSDAISIHPYNYCARLSPRTGWNVLFSVKDLRKKLREKFPDRDVPIYISEIGWPDVDGACGGVPQDVIADNVAQILLEAPTLPWLKGVWLYELMDQGTDPEYREHHFGLYDREQAIKPAGCAAKTVWDFIADTTAPSLQMPYWPMNYITYDTATDFKHVAVWNMRLKPLTRWAKFPENTQFISLCGAEIPDVNKWVKVGRTPILAKVPKDSMSSIEFKETLSSSPPHDE